MAKKPLRIIPLGGLGEIGKNMLILEREDIIIVDAGIMFPEENMPGIDFIIPDISYLVKNRDRVKGIIITHGHEDHIGALPHILRQLNVPIYATGLSHALIAVKLKGQRDLRDINLIEVPPDNEIKLGEFKVQFFHVCHSIPDAMGLAIQTPYGLVIHTGDFKIDHTPADGKPTDLTKLANLASKGVLLLLSDSTYAEVPGYTQSEMVVGDALDRAIGDADGRVLVASFASLISRIQQVINAAEKHGRHMAVVGRSMVDNVDMCFKMGYLSAPPGLMLPIHQIKSLPPDKVVIMTTGSQGEPTSALVRMANKDHREIQIHTGDTVIISASPIPGNETVVAKTIDNLWRQGARVLHSRTALVHVHGHASQEELKMILNLVKPKFFVPVHGEYRHLIAHVQLAQSLGMPAPNTFVLEDGDVLELSPSHGRVSDKVPAGHIYVDGSRLWDTNSLVVQDRKSLSREGIVVVIVTIDKTQGNLLTPPEIVTSGFVDLDKARELVAKTSDVAIAAITQYDGHKVDSSLINRYLKERLGKFIYEETRQKPVIVPVVIEI
jgi:ribonuclease J